MRLLLVEDDSLLAQGLITVSPAQSEVSINARTEQQAVAISVSNAINGDKIKDSFSYLKLENG